MIEVNTQDRSQRIKFSKVAAKYFERNPEKCTYCTGSLSPGELVAMKHNDHNIIIVRLSDDELELYPNVISVDRD